MPDQLRRIKVSDIPPTTFRLEHDLRSRLQREAAINGRSLNQEVTMRLRASLGAGPAVSSAVIAQEPGQRSAALGDTERQMLAYFRRLSVERQLALLTVLQL